VKVLQEAPDKSELKVFTIPFLAKTGNAVQLVTEIASEGRDSEGVYINTKGRLARFDELRFTKPLEDALEHFFDIHGDRWQYWEDLDGESILCRRCPDKEETPF